MKHSFLLVWFVAFVLIPLTANLVENQPVEVTQPDGSKLSLYVSGDEYYHRVHDENGYTILKDPQTGYAVYAVPDGNSIQISDHVVGRVDPATLGIEPNLRKYDPEAEAEFLEQQRLRQSADRASSTGTMNNVVCFVRFSDQQEFPATPNYAFFDNMYNSMAQPSLKDYYDEVSNGQLTLNSYLRPASAGNIISIQNSHNRGYYSPFDLFNNPTGYLDDAMKNVRMGQLVAETLLSLDGMLDDSINLDNDNNGRVDGLTLLINGPTDPWGDLLWPAQHNYGMSAGSLNGKEVWEWIFEFEGLIGVSVISHETGHLIGAPDLYHYPSAPMGSQEPWGSITPVYKWDLMANDVAQHMLTYTKWQYGHWFPEVPLITPTPTPTTYTLTAIDQNPYSCFKIQSSIYNQYYMVEYRRQAGRYEANLPGSGLIVYRIITGIDGNSQGPPDEVYVYRPGGIVNTNGNPDNAFFSAQSGRTGIYSVITDPQPWLYVDTAGTYPGNLVITDIGASGGTTISFTVSTGLPNYWLGGVSNNWMQAANWSSGVPNSSSNVVIRPGCTYYPRIDAIVSCNSLTMKNGTSLNLGYYSNLTVHTDIRMAGQLTLEYYASLDCVGSFYWENGATTTSTGISDINCQGNMEFLPGSYVNLVAGTVSMTGSADAHIRIYQQPALNNFHNNKTAGTLYIDGVSTAGLRTGGNFVNYTGNTLVHNSTQSFYVGYNYTNAATGLVQFNQGTLVLDSANNANLLDANPASYYKNLTVAKTNISVLHLNGGLTVLGNVTVQSGNLDAATFNLTVGGDWGITPQPGQGFIRGTSTVTFTGTGIQNISGPSAFYNLVLNKASGELVFTANAQISCTSYQWVLGHYRVAGGSLTVEDLANDAIYGYITLDSGSISYSQDSANHVDLRAVLTIHNGTFTVNGGNGPVCFSYLTPATLNMDGGILDFKDVGILVWGGASFTENITGGTIKTRLGFECQRTDYHPSGGTLELYGTGYHFIEMVAGSSLYHLTINKAAARQNDEALNSETDPPRNLPNDHVSASADYRIGEILAVTNIQMDGNLYVQAGNFNVNGHNIETAYDMRIAANLTMTIAANLYCGRDFHWDSGSTTSVSTGNFFCWGSWYFKSGSAAHLTGSTTNLKSNGIGGIISSSNNSWFGDLNIYGTDEQGCYYQIEAASTSDLAIMGSLQVFQDNVLNLNFNRNLSVSNDVTIYANGCINADYGSATTITVGRNWTDSNTGYSTVYGFNPGTSTVVFNGGTASTLTVSPTVYAFYNLTINKAAGIAVNFPKSVQVLGNCNLTSGIWNDTVSGLTEAFYGNFIMGANGVWAITNRNTVAFYGSADQTFSTSGSNYIYNLTLAKTAGTVTLGSNLISQNAGTININNGTLNLNHFYFRTTGEIAIGNTGVLSIDADAWLEVADTKTLNVNSGGLLEVLGEGSSHPARLTRQTGVYKIRVNSGGTISAEYAVFEYMGTGGVLINSGALVSEAHSFHHCTFQNGLAGAALLVINNAQTITINQPVFPANTWGGTFNVRKTVDEGTVNIYSASGAFSGEEYDGDNFNRINWLGGLPDLVVGGYGLSNSNPVIGTSVYYDVYVTNDSDTDCTTPFQVGLYVNSATQPGVGSGPDYTRTVTSLPAHETVICEFNAVTNNVPATWTSWFVLDYSGAVSEAAEGNNIWGPRTVTWLTLPPIAAPAISRISATDTVRLDWTYPYTVTRYKVYRSTDPFSGFTLVATPSVRYHEEAASALKYFYRVTAELNP